MHGGIVFHALILLKMTANLNHYSDGTLSEHVSVCILRHRYTAQHF